MLMHLEKVSWLVKPGRPGLVFLKELPVLSAALEPRFTN